MPADSNQAIVRRIFAEVISQGDLTLADALIADEFVNHDPRGPQQGRDAFKQGLFAVREAFPDWESTLDDLVGDGDKIGARWTVRGTHQGSFLGIAPTGRRITMQEAGLLRLQDGMLVEIWRVADELALLQQLGALPQFGQSV
jgi:predicted ester cyclase